MSTTIQQDTSGALESLTPEQQQYRMTRAKRAGWSAFLGGALEYYDFFVYATAASLVFPHIFFPETGSDALTMVASFGTLGVAYVARPFGALVFGHLGDRIGRKSILLATLLLMGGATFLIGVLPTYQQIGLWAPILLVVLRLAQGLSAGAEIAGASALSTEEAPVGLRGFFPSFSISGIAAGIVLASLAFLPVTAMDEADRLSWGWRLPFLASILVLAVAWFVRRQLAEPEDFQETKDAGEQEKAPFLVMLKTHPVQFVQISILSLQVVTNTLMQAFGLSYATSVGIDSSTMLWVTIVGNIVAIFTTPAAAYLSDKIGRKPTFIAGTATTAVMIWVYFNAIASANIALIFVTSTIILGVTYAMSNAVYPAWFSELFNVKVRYSGVAVGLQVGILVSGFTPMIATALVGDNYANWGPAAWLVTGATILATLVALTTRETYKTPLRELGNPVSDAEIEAGLHHGSHPRSGR
ncbi:MFS transporter [Citricoccus sp.]|uniref:MFS transporter n=1 Tax=Citricoccus sp. TaxID=1978372 RepID=UPI0028BEA78B|nr:MFS transporter [Citricoccus sp.]